MIQSMTGYGKVEFNLKNKNFIIEVKSLNSKTIDINLKIPAIYRDKEIVLRKVLSEKLKRGKVELAIWREKSQTNSSYKFDKELIRKYHNQLDSIKKEFDTKSKFLKRFFSNNNIDLIPTILKMPDVLIKKDEKIEKEEWIENYFIQGAAYCEMYEERFDQPIERVVILVVTEDGAVQTFSKSKDDYLPLLKTAIKDFNEENN